ncbi:MAG TPA: ATP-dependent zinc metalloprotease FtsH [Kofleriaceae bacterium]|nr:ATP-dependent zinc metalloprotease FtsH [Kofleriaceae bacterium]
MPGEILSAPPRPKRPWISWIVLALGFALAWSFTSRGTPTHPEVDYTTAYRWIQDGKVTTVTLTGPEMTGKLVAPQPFGDRVVDRFRTLTPADEDLVKTLRAKNVAIEVVNPEPSILLQLLTGLLPWILIIGVWWWLARRARNMLSKGGPFGGFLKRGKRFEKSLSGDVTFDNVAGLTSAKRDLEEIVQFLREPDRAARLGARVPRGVLLVGPPGTGKTLLARAVAGEAGVPFYSISASEFIEMFVGVGAARVRELFEEAKKNAPGIVFIDEIDAVGRARGAGLGGGHDEREQTLNQLLSEMDGFDRNDRVVVLAATNRPDVLDPALLRPGRFDRRVIVELPEAGARRAILGVHTRGKPLDPDVDLDRIAESTVGFSGADLANLANEAALMTTRRRGDHITRADFAAAYDKIVLGDPREGKLREIEKRRVAVHEAGHALVAWVTPDAAPIRRVSILPRGMALGATHQAPTEDRHLHTYGELAARLRVLLGGYAAERAVLGDVSTGAEHDLKEATRIASKMVAHYGMSEQLGPVYYEHQEEHVFLGQRVGSESGASQATVHAIETEARGLLSRALDGAGHVLDSERPRLDALVAALLDRETLEREELEALLGPRAADPNALPVTAPIPPSTVAPTS